MAIMVKYAGEKEVEDTESKQRAANVTALYRLWKAGIIKFLRAGFAFWILSNWLAWRFFRVQKKDRESPMQEMRCRFCFFSWRFLCGPVWISQT